MYFSSFTVIFWDLSIRGRLFYYFKFNCTEGFTLILIAVLCSIKRAFKVLHMAFWGLQMCSSGAVDLTSLVKRFVKQVPHIHFLHSHPPIWTASLNIHHSPLRGSRWRSVSFTCEVQLQTIRTKTFLWGKCLYWRNDSSKKSLMRVTAY